MTPVRLEPAALRSRVKRSTTEPLRSLDGHRKYITGRSVPCKNNWYFRRTRNIQTMTNFLLHCVSSLATSPPSIIFWSCIWSLSITFWFWRAVGSSLGIAYSTFVQNHGSQYLTYVRSLEGEDQESIQSSTTP